MVIDTWGLNRGPLGYAVPGTLCSSLNRWFLDPRTTPTIAAPRLPTQCWR